MSHTKISAADFIKHFSNPGKPVHVQSEFEVDDPVIFNNTNYNCDQAEIENVIFNELVLFEDLSVSKVIKFKNCSFNKPFRMARINISGYEPRPLDTSFIAKGCEFSSLLIESSTFERGLKITKCTVKKLFTIVDSSILSSSIDIDKSRLSIVRFSKLDLKGNGLKINNSEIHEYVRLQSIASDNSISLIRSRFYKDVYIWSGVVRGLTLNDGEYAEDVRIHAVRNNGTLSVIGDTFKKTLQIDNSDSASSVSGGHDKVYLRNIRALGGLVMNGSNESTEELSIICSVEQTGTFQFNSCEFQRLEFNSDNHKSNFFFNYVSFGRIHFNHFNNYGNLTLSSCKALGSPNTEFIVYNSNLGKAQFQNVFLNSFQKVSIIDSLLASIEFSGMHWFRPEVLDVGDMTSPHRRIRDVYRQLKQASEKQNDRFQALEFQALELAAYKREIRQKGKLFSNDGLILWLGQTNNYGLNWLKPMWLLLLVSTLFYFPIVISASWKIKWAPACNYSDLKVTLQEFMDYSYMWPQLYNPARTLRHAFHDGVVLSSGVYFWDMIQRIILAFFIVQIVSAFRKYFKA